MPTLRTLLNLSRLELALHCGEPDITFDAVRMVDEASDRAWLEARDLRLTSRVFQLPRPQPDPCFVASPSALGYALQSGESAPPKALLERAKKRKLSLFSIPPSVNPEQVRDEALRLSVSENLTGLRAGASVQRYLLAGLDSVKPERDILARLHTLTRRSFVLFSPWGSVLARAGPLGQQDLPAPPETLPEGRYELAGRSALLFRVAQGERLQGVLLALDSGMSMLPLLELARALLQLSASRRNAQLAEQEALRGALLSEWLGGRSEPNELRARLRQAGLEESGVYTVVACDLGTVQARRARQRYRLEQLKKAGDEFFYTLALPTLSALRGEHCLWVMGGSHPETHLEALKRALERATGERVRLGYSPPQRELSAMTSAYRQALLALQSARFGEAIKAFSRLDPVSWVLEQQPRANLQALCDQLIGPLKEADQSGKLWRTLVRYLHSANDLKQLAAELHIHVNTLRYRLDKIETLIGLPLSQPETLAKLYLAEQINSMLEDAAKMGSGNTLHNIQ